MHPERKHSVAAPVRTIVVSDVHGSYWNLSGLLHQEGVIDDAGKRVPGWLTYQVGDLLHCGPDTGNDDLITLQLAREWFDVIAIGNHEFPFVFHPGGERCANSYDPRPETLHLMRTMFAEGQYAAAFVVKNEWLVTHAGLHPHFFSQDYPQGAHDAARMLVNRFVQRVLSNTPDPIFDAVDWERGGMDRVGGVLWGSWPRLAKAYEGYVAKNKLPLRQIVGHTPRSGGYSCVRTSSGEPVVWCIDAGSGLSSKLSALVDDGAGTPLRPVVYEGVRRL